MRRALVQDEAHPLRNDIASRRHLWPLRLLLLRGTEALRIEILASEAPAIGTLSTRTMLRFLRRLVMTVIWISSFYVSELSSTFPCKYVKNWDVNCLFCTKHALKISNYGKHPALCTAKPHELFLRTFYPGILGSSAEGSNGTSSRPTSAIYAAPYYCQTPANYQSTQTYRRARPSLLYACQYHH